jgi:xanthine dehydrogenase large subunit
MTHLDTRLHATGTSRFLDDLPLPAGTLHAMVVTSPCAHGVLQQVDVMEALAMPRVRAILTAVDIPGENQIGTIVQDEPLLASGEVHFQGEPVALVIADTPEAAARARDAVKVTVSPIPAIMDPREAFAAGGLLAPPSIFCSGDTEAAWENCAVVVKGMADSGGQEHLYLETQGAVAVPMEDGRFFIRSGTQGPAYVQRITARVLGLPMNRVEVDVIRLGGAFGGKEDQATPWAVLAALGTWKTGRPVRLVLGRREDMRLTGKRHPYSSDYRLGLDRNGRMLAWEVTYYQNGGAVSDLSTAILERTLFHSTGSYRIPNVRAAGICCRTNTPPNTAFRGFGAPQAMFVMECAVRHAAEALGMPVRELQEKNLLSTGDLLPYGMEYRGDEVRRSWDRVAALYNPVESIRDAEVFHAAGGILRRGVSLMPVCFGVSFTNTSMNQASALVHVYTDGSVGVSTGAVEMGQGVNSKLRLVASRVFGIDPGRVRVETTNTTRNANTSPTAASSGADMNGHAVRIACTDILGRLLAWARDSLGFPPDTPLGVSSGQVTADGSPCHMDWDALVRGAYLARVDLSAHAHYATPGIWFDRNKGKGEPFAYHVAGTAVTEVTLDTLRGTYTVDSVRICHDCGSSLAPRIDLGQIEGGLLQGIGWMTMEELKYHPETGALLSDSLATYKVPDIYSAPPVLEIDLLECTSDNAGVFNSKAVGEPPFMYGIGTFTALTDALRSAGVPVPPGGCWTAPLTPERILLLLEESRGNG